MYPVPRISIGDSGRQLTPELWNTALEKYANDPTVGYFFFDDFKTPQVDAGDAALVLGNNSPWFVQDAAAGGTSENFDTVEGQTDGHATLSATTGTDHFGIEAWHAVSATQGALVALNTHATLGKGECITEWRVSASAGFTGTFFLGFTECIADFLSATGTLPTTSDYIGFYRLNGGDLHFVAANDNAGGTAVTADVTIMTDAAFTALLTAGGQINYGFRVGADNKVSVAVDGNLIQLDTSGAPFQVSSLALPIESLTEKISILRGADTDEATVTAVVDFVATYVGN